MSDNFNLKKSLDELGESYITELTKQLIEADKVATGSLIRSLDYKVVKTMNGFMVKILANDYLTYVNDGRRPGKMPPPSKITRWIEAKKISLKGKSKEQVGFAMAKSISLKGIKPSRVIEKAQKELIATRDRLILNGIQKDIEITIKKTFDEINK